MKLWFRLPESDEEDELDEALLPPEPPKLPSGEMARGAVFLGVGVVIACQLLVPVALPFLLVFGALGASAGALLAFQDRELAAVAFLVWVAMEELFSSPYLDLRWVASTAVIAAGAFFLGAGMTLLIRRAWEARHGG